MAILSKYRKNKKEGRNSVLPPKVGDSPVENRQASTSTTASSVVSGGAYDSMPMGAAPDTKYQNPNPTQGQQQRNPSGSSIPTPKPMSPQQGFRSSSSGSMQKPMAGGLNNPPSHHPSYPHQKNLQHSQFPWSQVALSNASPFPRYGHAANPVAARDGEVFVMGGLKGSNVFGDLWVIDSGYLLDTEGCPSPRVGHASLTLGNAYIVFGGDTKIEENDELDDNLYLLNTTTLKWTVANSVGMKPSGRYGHSISTVGSKVYIFGGQLDDHFFDDLVCYDLTTLRSPNSQWELIKPESASPPSRTNHTVVTFQEKLYLFGGTDGKLWYSDTWCYDPALNTWSLLECSGFIPAPCEGHSATIVGDIMYIFGGRSSQGKDLNTLSALKLTTRKWFTFQNLGPGPSPRSGHSMTTFAGHKILVMGGESPDVVSSEEVSEDKNHTVFVLDTSRINYPPDSTSPPPPHLLQQRSLSNNSNHQKPVSPPPYQDLPGHSKRSSMEKKSIDENIRSPSGLSEMAPGVGYERVDVGPESYDDGMSATTYESIENPQEEDEKRMLVENDNGPYSPVRYDDHMSLKHRESIDTMTETNKNESRTKTPDVSNIPGAWNSDQAVSNEKDTTTVDGSSYDDTNDTVQPDSVRNDGEVIDDAQQPDTPVPIKQEASDRELNNFTSPTMDDKQVSNVQQALERLKASNSWYETELAAAKDAGYVPSSRPPVDVLKLRRVSQRLTHDTADTLNEREILVTALNELKEELDSVQANVKMQAEAASERISAAEKARDEALQQVEIMRQGGSNGSRGLENGTTPDGERNLVEGSEQSVIISGLESKVKELESKLDHSNKTRALLIGGDSEEQSYRQMEELRSNNINLEKQLRTQTDKLVLAEHELAQMRNQLEQVETRCTDLEATADDKVQALSTLGYSLQSAEERAAEAGRQLTEHQSVRAELEQKILELEQQAEEDRQRIETSQRDLDEHRGLLEHANAQNEHASLALTNHIGKIVTMWGASKSFNKRSMGGSTKRQSTRSLSEDGDTTIAEDEEGVGEEDPRYAELQRQMEQVNQLHETHRAAADKATDELTQALQEISLLKQQLATADGSRSGTEEQLNKSMEEVKQMKLDLEQNQAALDEMTRNHGHLQSKLNEADESGNEKFNSLQEEYEQYKSQREKEYQDLDKQHEARYSELEQDYEKSLQYFKNTETALSRTREELAKYKDMNNKLKEELNDMKLRTQEDEEGSAEKGMSAGMASPSLGKYSTKNFDLQLRDLRAQIIILQEERDDLRENILDLKKKSINTKADLDDAQSQVEELQRQNDELRSKLHNVNGNGA